MYIISPSNLFQNMCENVQLEKFILFYENFIFLILLLIILNHRGTRNASLSHHYASASQIKRDEPKMEHEAPELAREGHG